MVHIASYVQRFILFCCVPLILITRALSLNKIDATAIYSEYDLFQKPTFESEIATLPLAGKIGFFVIESVAILFIAAALWHFWQLLELQKKGTYFSMVVIERLRKISILLLAWSVYQLFFVTIASLFISFFKMPGQRCVMAAIGSEDVIRFFVVLILFLLLRIIQEAYKIKVEQDLVV